MVKQLVRETVIARPWDSFGTKIQEARTVEEGLKAANLDWQVGLRKLRTNDVPGIPITSHQAVVRLDSKQPLGIVGPKYQPLQNVDAFGWFEPFLENGLVTLENAGSFRSGKLVFILAKMAGDAAEVVAGDQIENYLLLSNAHDGSRAVSIALTPIRVYCQNTLTAALNSELTQQIRVIHRGDVVNSINMVRDTVDLINQQFLMSMEQYQEMSKNPIKSADLVRYVNQVFTIKSAEKIIQEYDESLEIENNRKRLVSRIEEIFELEPAKTTWNMYNAVNSYVNHERGKNTEARYDSNWFGLNRAIDKKAFDIARNLY